MIGVISRKRSFVVAGFVAGLLSLAFSGTAAATPAITLFSDGLNSGSTPNQIAVGPDGNLWFTDGSSKTPAIGEINPTTQAVTEYSTGLQSGSIPVGITAGPDGDLWFTDVGCITEVTGVNCAIGEISPTTHAITEYPVDSGSVVPESIAAGPDGNLWFTDGACFLDLGACEIGEFNPSSKVSSEYAIASGSAAGGIVAGPDGNVWFTDDVSANQAPRTSSIDAINPSTDVISTFSTGLNPYSYPTAITVGPGGNLWFTDTGFTLNDERYSSPAIGVINPSTHAISESSTGLDTAADPTSIAAGTDGNLWFTNDGCAAFGFGGPCAIGEVNPSTDAITQYATGLNSDAPAWISAGPTGNGDLWFTADGSPSAIGMVAPGGSTTGTTGGSGTTGTGTTGGSGTTDTQTGGSAKPSCTVTAKSSKVLLPQPKKKGHKKPKGKPGTLQFVVRCNQAASAKLTGTLTEKLKPGHQKKGKHHKKPTKTLKLAAVRAPVTAVKTITLTLRLSNADLAALKAGIRESVAVILTATDASASSTANAEIARLKPTKK